MDYEQQYSDEVKIFNNIVTRYSDLQENNIGAAYGLMRDSLQAYNRWSKIKHDIKQVSKRGENSATKERLKEICEYLKEVHTDARVIYGNSRDDLRHNKESF